MPLRRFFLALLMIVTLLALFFAPLATPRRTLAFANDAITITSQAYSVHFPDSITFTASASDANSTFVAATIVVNLRSAAGPESYPVPIGNSLRTLRLTWKVSTSGDNFLPPGSDVFYYWRFTDKAGDTYVEPMQQLTTIDTRFNWQHLSQGLLQVDWYNRSADFGQMILTQASGDIQRTSSTLGGGLTQPINLWVYASDSDFHGSLPPGTYEWVGGIAFPTLDEASIVAVGASDYTLIRDMPHELTHLVFHQLIAQGITAPTWFDEGLAVYNQTFREPELRARWEKALAAHSLLRLSQIADHFPADADQAYLAYAQSWQLLDYMYTTFEKPRMVQLIKLMNNPQTTFEQDLKQALGVDQLHLENQWRISKGQAAVLTPNEVKQTPQPVIQVKQAQNVSTNYTTFWVLIGLGIFLVLVSLISLIVLVMYSVRHTKALKEKANAPAPMNWQQGNQAFTYPYSDPSTYMQTSMYTQPSSQPVSPYQGSEYPLKTPREQAPQE